MEKFYKATMRAFGGKPNGTGKTSCVDDAMHVKQIITLLLLAFSMGGLLLGYKGLPAKVSAMEKELIVVKQEVIAVKSINESIDDRLGRIESALIRRR